MYIIYKLTAILSLCILFYACEQPGSPDFKTEQKVQAPLTINNSYQFLGTDEALIDTTSEDFDSLFTTDEDDFVTLSQEQNFDFGNLNDAIPDISVDPTTFNSKVGTLELGDFTSGTSDVGRASFEDITGEDPSNYNQGDNIPDSPDPPLTTSIDLNTDQFESAVLSEDGTLELTLTNNLGFEVDELSIELFAGSTQLGSDTIAPFNDEDQQTAVINLNSGDNLSDLKIKVTAQWQDKTLEREPDNLVVDGVSGNNLVASEVTAALPSQQFSSNGTTSIDNSDFEFTQSDHFVEFENGELNIFDILNEIPLEIQNLEITFPEIRSDENNDDNYDQPLVVTKTIPRADGSPGQASDEFIDLSGYRVYAEGNEITYEITGTTEDTGSDTRTISEDDEFTATTELENLELNQANGIISPRRILVNEDDPSNGTGQVDLFNDNEAETVSIEDLEQLSEQLDGIEFVNPELDLIYETDIGVETDIIAAIYGTDPNGNEVYLNGKEGEETYVDDNDIPSELTANGNALESNQLIRFPIDPSEDGSAMLQSTAFNDDNSNVDEFMNELPTNVRFIGVADINNSGGEGTVQSPILFDPSLNVGIPIHFRSESASFSDTTDADLSELPDNKNRTKLTEATLGVTYTNGLPLDVELNLLMLDENEEVIIELPRQANEPIGINAAAIDSNTRFASEPNEDQTTFSLNSDQLDVLSNTRKMVIEISFNTTKQEDVKLRARDEISLSLNLDASLESEIN